MQGMLSTTSATMCAQMLLLTLVWTLLAVLPAARAALAPPHILDDDNTQLQLSLADLEREQEQRLDLNRPPLLPNHYDWHPTVAASVPPSYIHDAARLEHNERLRQLQQQHQQLSAGYALPSYLPGDFLQLGGGNVPPTSATTAITAPTTIATVKSGARLLKPIVPFDLDLQLQLNGVHYLNGNALPSAATLAPHPVHRPVRPPYTFIQQPPLRINPNHNHNAHPSQPNMPHLLQQSKQFAYAPLPQRNYAAAPRIPLPYPPSFVSITTRRPAAGYANGYGKPFRPSQPDPTPDLFAGRDSKSLLESYIPSWEVLRIYQQHQPHPPQQQQQHQPYQSHHHRPVHRHTLAYTVPGLRLFKRDSKLERLPERSRIVKKSLAKNAQP